MIGCWDPPIKLSLLSLTPPSDGAPRGGVSYVFIVFAECTGALVQLHLLHLHLRYKYQVVPSIISLWSCIVSLSCWIRDLITYYLYMWKGLPMRIYSNIKIWCGYNTTFTYQSTWRRDYFLPNSGKNHYLNYIYFYLFSFVKGGSVFTVFESLEQDSRF